MKTSCGKRVLRSQAKRSFFVVPRMKTSCGKRVLRSQTKRLFVRVPSLLRPTRRERSRECACVDSVLCVYSVLTDGRLLPSEVAHFQGGLNSSSSGWPKTRALVMAWRSALIFQQCTVNQMREMPPQRDAARQANSYRTAFSN